MVQKKNIKRALIVALIVAVVGSLAAVAIWYATRPTPPSGG